MRVVDFVSDSCSVLDEDAEEGPRISDEAERMLAGGVRG